jgi:UDP-N-acetylmuramate--alanine ligase
MYNHIHLVGIGGAGLSAIATVLLQQGYRVSGSDMQASSATERLQHLGAIVHVGHSADNLRAKSLGQPDVVVVSSAIAETNPEIEAARQQHIPVLKRPTWLGHMLTGKRALAIAGTHGKTTTTAMTALMLKQAGLSPGYIIGGVSPQLQGNAAAGSNDLFVIEADEYDRTFLSLVPEVTVITNIEWDHPDTYPSQADYEQAFVAFAGQVSDPSQIIVCGDDPGVKKLLSHWPQAQTYGLAADNLWQAVDLRLNEQGGYDFLIHHAGQLIIDQPVSMQASGQHNVLNGLAAFITATRVGVNPADAAQTLGAFAGTGRRMELKGEVNGITVIDDYAHHPTEVKATLAAAQNKFAPRPVWAIFQPHTFSRAKLYLNEFAASFTAADHVILLDIYPSREQDDGSISSANLLAQMRHPHAQHIGTISDCTTYLQQHLTPGDVVLTLSAGDGYRVGEGVLAALQSPC